ncbi:MAG TPA: D-cysteine desulfhydrase family protein [Thermomicrobiales bacterium]|nr:D-cysteine desulfhydrase family protein [Thermomicrobiales bacterium]
MVTEHNIWQRLEAFPRYPLTFLPTPLVRAGNLERALGDRAPQIWIKRDDMTGLAFGGNKSRKLEYLTGDAIDNGATVLISEGAAQSNHARQTAAAAAIAGLKCVLVLDTRRNAELTGNLLLDELLGADVHLVDGSGDRKTEMARVVELLETEGETPYSIPTGGSVPIGALGYVRCVAELMDQIGAHGIEPKRLYFPTGSQGTQAGLVAGALVFDAPFEIRGVAVEATTAELAQEALPLTNETLDLLGSDRRLELNEISIDDTQVGEGYAIPTNAGMAAIGLLARTEAIILDPVYTGKAMAALIADVRAGMFGPDDAIIYLHTGGGPSVFANLDAFAELLD